ncbi:MAG: translation elongation factor Ts [Planctomycetes bacterium]|nr:translation elongation factor Ts [Planctomycetota bacterium]
METTEVSFTAKDVMSLRQKTGLGMMDCKRALSECGGDMTTAEQWLRKELKGKLQQRSERATGEGRIAVAIKGSDAAIIEIRSETDFTARNESFRAMTDDLATMALAQPAGPIQPDTAMTARVDDVRLTTRENLVIARGKKLQGGSFGQYVHHDGKRAALVQIDGAADEQLLTGVCQHIVAHVPAPIGVSEQDVPAETLAQIRNDAMQEAADAGKPPEIVQKIADGKVRKYLQDNTLLNQKYVRDDTKTIKQLLPPGVTITRFVRYTVGAE